MVKKKRRRQPPPLSDEEMRDIGLERVCDEQGCLHVRRLDDEETQGNDRGLTRQILAIIARAMQEVDKATESDWTGILSGALDDIETLCKEGKDEA